MTTATKTSTATAFLSIAEAVEKTGRSPSTIRRIIKAIATTPKHPDRDAVEPTVKQADEFKAKGVTFAWKIREDVLLRECSKALVEEKKKDLQPKGDILHLLERELSLKNQQIEKQWEVIQALNDRLREGNILMGSLQKQLAAPSTPPPAAPIVEMSSTVPSKEAVEAIAKKPSKSSAKDAAAKPSKKGFLRWFR